MPFNFGVSREYPALPKSVIGVLYDGANVVTPGYVASGYQLGVDGANYAVWFPSESEVGMHPQDDYPVTLPKGTKTTYERLVRFNSERENGLGLGQSVHLVEIEVNGGRGSSSSELVATQIRSVEGTIAYPMRVSERLEEVRARFDRIIDEKEPEIAATLRVAQEQAVKMDERGGASGLKYRFLPEGQSYGFIATWRSKERRLSAVYTYSRRSQVKGSRTIECTSGEMPPRCQCPRKFARLAHASVSMAVGFELDVTGRVVEEVIYAPKSRAGRPRDDPANRCEPFF